MTTPKNRIYLKTKADMTPRVAAVFACLDVSKFKSTALLADQMADNYQPWLGKTRLQINNGVASALYELRANGWIESRKKENSHGMQLHRAFARRHIHPQSPLRGSKKANGAHAPTVHAEPDTSPMNRVLAAAARIETDVNILAEALCALQDQLNTFKTIEEAVRNLPKQ